MLKNSLFFKIILIFTIPIFGILYFSYSNAYDKYIIAKEFEENYIRMEYLEATEKLILSLEVEKRLSIEQLNSKNLNKDLKKVREDKTYPALEDFKKIIKKSNFLADWKTSLYELTDCFGELENTREDIDSFSLSQDDAISRFNYFNRKLVKTLFFKEFQDFVKNYDNEILKIDNYFSSNANNIENLEISFKKINLSLESEINAYKHEIEFEKNLSYIFFLLCLVTLIPLFFVLKNLVSSQEDALKVISKHKRVYELLNQTDKFLEKTLKKDKVYSDICELLMEAKDLQFCFIYDAIDKKIVASKECEIKDIMINNLDNFNDFSQETLVSKTIKRDSNIIINNFKEKNLSVIYDQSIKLNINSMATFPIKKFNEVIGALILYSTQVDFFDKEVEVLFDKLVGEITNYLEKIDYEIIKDKQDKELRLSSCAFEFSTPMIITDDKNTIINANRAFCKLMDYSKDELIGENPRIFKTGHQDKDFIERLWHTLKIDGVWSGDVYNRASNGKIIALRSTITAIRNEDNKVTHYLGQYVDISEHKDKEKVLEYKATHDNLTGLPNRLLLINRIEHAITRTIRHKIYGGLIFIDLDNFKTINDTLGHDIGDVLLITVAKKIKSCIRDEDTVSRIGGDEFIVLLDNIGNNSADARRNITYVAEKIKNSLNSITHIDGHKNISTPSIGITLFSDASVSVQDIIKQADTAMYSAKKQGKNAIEFF